VLELLKQIILDHQAYQPETGTPRHLNMKRLPGKASVCIGARRSGKSTYFFQLIQELLSKGVPSENILYVNFFDDRLHSLNRENLGLITEAYFSLYPQKKNAEKIFCFFDEIQSVEGWESYADRLMRTEKCEVSITGSSSRMLSKEVATQMRGRALSWELFPFSFREYLDHLGIAYGASLSTKRRLSIQKAFDRFWETGGFPEVAKLDARLRVKIHQEYFNAALFRDLIDRHDISHPRAAKDLALRLIDTTGSMYSVNSLTGHLQSLGHKAPKSAVSDYLDWFEDAFFLFTVRVFDASLARSKTNPKKIYCIDHSLVTSVASGILANTGHLLENLVFTALRRLTPRIHYWKSKRGREVDFIVQFEDRTRMLVQVTESLARPDVRKRETAALEEAMADLGFDAGIIVTRSETEEIKTGNRTIRVIPAWRFLLDPTAQ